MKLRFEHNSLRLRVRKSDLEKLSADGVVIETVAFSPTALFTYKLRLDPNGLQTHAHWKENGLTVCIPEAQGVEWIRSEEVAIENKLSVDSVNQLLILIEKDFPCKDQNDEDQADTFRELAEKTASAIC